MSYTYKDANIDGEYRYTLIRCWETNTGDRIGVNPMVFLMLNPSTADAMQDDPTIRRCVGFAKREGCDSLVVMNLFALRATDPKKLLDHPNPEGDKNEDAISMMGRFAKKVVAAWGTKGTLNGQDKKILSLLRKEGIVVYCLGKTKDGHPRHPLYVKSDTPLEIF